MQLTIITVMMAFALAHEGPHGQSIQNGRTEGKDKVIYLDAGPDIQWANKKLKRKVTDDNQILYQFIGDIPDNTKMDGTETLLPLKAPGGQLMKSFSFEHAGEWPDQLVVHSPDLSGVVEISKHADFPLRWEVKTSASMIKIIIEVHSGNGALKGRLNISTNDDGEFNIPAHLLAQLPEGNSRIAIKRIWLGGGHPFDDPREMLGIRTVSSVVGQAKIVD